MKAINLLLQDQAVGITMAQSSPYGVGVGPRTQDGSGEPVDLRAPEQAVPELAGSWLSPVTFQNVSCGRGPMPLRPPVTPNPSMVGLAGTSGVPQPNPLPKQGHPQQAAQHRGQGGWNISREGDSPASLGSLGQGSVTLSRKKFFLMSLP